VPLKAGKRVIGVLEVYTRTPRQWSGDEVRLLLTFAAQATVALQNARLVQESGRAARHAGLLRGLLDLALAPDPPPPAQLVRVVADGLGRDSEPLGSGGDLRAGHAPEPLLVVLLEQRRRQNDGAAGSSTDNWHVVAAESPSFPAGSAGLSQENAAAALSENVLRQIVMAVTDAFAAAEDAQHTAVATDSRDLLLVRGGRDGDTALAVLAAARPQHTAVTALDDAELGTILRQALHIFTRERDRAAERFKN
jgi:hypothetical protein